jgi:peptide/nickel transport system permease protein
VSVNASEPVRDPAPAEPGGSRAATGRATVEVPPPRRSGRSAIVRALLSNKPAVGGLVVLGLLLLAALFGPSLAPYGANEGDVLNAQLLPPTGEHWFGTDDQGRDVFSRVLIASRVSVQVAVVSVAIALVVGVPLGLLAGFYRRLDDPVMRLMDMLFAFPAILLAIAILAVRGPGTTNTMIAIGVVYMPIFARITRASVLTVREQVFVRAARSLGASDLRLLRLHVLPNVMGPILVQTSLSLAFAILTEAALSFVGLGVQPPDPSWGRLLFEGRGFVEIAWWMAVFPGLAILVTVLAFNLVGDALRDALDPRQRSAIAARGAA